MSQKIKILLVFLMLAAVGHLQPVHIGQLESRGDRSELANNHHKNSPSRFVRDVNNDHQVDQITDEDNTPSQADALHDFELIPEVKGTSKGKFLRNDFATVLRKPH